MNPNRSDIRREFLVLPAFRTVRRLLVHMLFALFTASTANALVISTFDTSAQGWLITGDNASVWSATGGNPGGCFDVNDLATGDINRAVAPPAYLGDWRAMTSADSITFDFLAQLVSGTVYVPPYVFQISGPGGVAHALAGYTPPQNVWTTVGVPLDSTQWVIESGSWSAILAQVNVLLIEVEYVTGNEEFRFDNVRLTGTVTPIFEPCVFETFTAAGLGDWSFASTGGVTNPGAQGNSGGYCRVADGTGTSYALAPARFLGDWSALLDTGRLTIDVRMVTIGGPIVDVPQFIRLSGPGGVAHVSLTAAQIPSSLLKWKHFEFPLQAGVWTLDSGTWAGLLQNVTECRIQAEFVNGSEVVGLDNFGRLAASCPALDESVVLHSTEYERCGYESFVTIGGIAVNPTDGELYGLVDAASGSGGGLYRVTGAGAGVRLQAYTTPAQIQFDAAGSAFISEDTGGNVYRFAAGVSSTWVSGFHAGDDDPSGMCIAPPGFDGPNVDPGDVLVMDPGFGGPDELWSFKTTSPEGELQVFADLPGDPDFRDIAAGPAGVVYTASTTDSTSIYAISALGVLTPIALSIPLAGMHSMAYDPAAERLYVAENRGNTVRRINPATGVVELLASGFGPFTDGALEYDAIARVLYVADASRHRVYRFCRIGTTSVASIPGPTADRDITAITVSPNPAQGATRIAWSLRGGAVSRVIVHDVAGRVVRRLALEPVSETASSLLWDGRDDSGQALRAGLYLVRVETNRDARSGWITILR